jgi:hypothetical protein
MGLSTWTLRVRCLGDLFDTSFFSCGVSNFCLSFGKHCPIIIDNCACVDRMCIIFSNHFYSEETINHNICVVPTHVHLSNT